MLFGRRKRAIRRIMIVEDEPLVAFDNEHFLRDAGYEVAATVDTVADALQSIRATPPDLVVSDVRLSDGGTGVDVARAAKDQGIPVLFVTGSCPVEARELSIGCLAKPYSQRDLLAAIEAVDDAVAGRPLKRLPRGLTIFGEDRGVA